MAYTDKELREHYTAETERRPAQPTKRPSLDDYDNGTPRRKFAPEE